MRQFSRDNDHAFYYLAIVHKLLKYGDFKKDNSVPAMDSANFMSNLGGFKLEKAKLHTPPKCF